LKEFKSKAMRNKQLLLSLLILLLSALRVDAATYTVKAGGGGSFATIQACANAAVAGDTCVVYAGKYNETPSLNTSGSSGSPITFSVNPGDCVTVSGFNLNSESYVTIGTPNTSHCTSGAVTYSGFEITGSSISWTQIHNVTIQNNYIHDVSDMCLAGPGTTASGASTFVYVLNNTLTSCGGPGGLAGGIAVEGNHWLIDGNTISHIEDGVYLYGAFMVVRNNHFGPITAAEQGSNHPDAIESTCTAGSDYPLQHMLFEGNTIQDWRSPDGHGLLLRDTQSCGMTDNVMRFNQFVNVGSYWTSNETNSFNQLWYNNSSNNTEADFSPKEFSNLTFTQGDTGANVINNSFANDWTATPYCIYVDGSAISGFVENHNACFLSGFSGTWQNPSGSYSGTDIFNQDPKYVNANSDLHIQSGSPLIGKGGPLTTAVSTGASSTSLAVSNAKFFSDGYGLTGVQPDWVRIGPSATAQIASVNYSSNVITLASAASWSSGASVYLYKNSNGTIVLTGANPDIGAFPSGSSSPSGGGSQPPLPPTNLQAVPK
jgi:hypothetical protein